MSETLITDGERAWRRFAMYCAAHLHRDQIADAAKRAGIDATFCAPPASAAGREREMENVISGLRARIGEAYASGNRRELGEHLDALCALAGSKNALVTAGWRQLLSRLSPERGGEEETKP